VIRHFRAADGRRLAYRDEGEGPAVLCLAGLTRNGRDFDALAAHLAPRHRVIRLDSRGRGASEWADDPLHEYAMPVEAGDALALIRHLGLERVGIVGTSRGGVLGMSVASAVPGLVRALVLNDVGAVIEGRGLLRIFATLGRAPRAEDFDAAAAALREANAPAFPDVPLERWRAHAEAIYDADAAGRPVLAYDPHLRSAVAASLEGDVSRISLWPLFDSLPELPLLVIRGENSDILLHETAAHMAERHAGLRTLEVPNRGHAPFLDEPVALRAIDGFLGEHLR